MNARFPNLFSEIVIGECIVPNRIVSTGHHTYLADRMPSDELIAYYEARARGGVGLIVTEIVAVHETAGFSKDLLKADNRDVIPAYARLVEACHRHGTKVFAQLFHPGREILSACGGMLPVAWAPSAVPNERFHIMPKPMPVALIEEIITGFGAAAALLVEAGFDGVEIVGSHGYLPAQFLNPRVNFRDDAYGGDDARRLRFLHEVIAATRGGAKDHVVGLRLSGAEMDGEGLTQHETLSICETVAPELDYLSVVAGTSNSLGGSVHIVPPMGLAAAYTAPFAAAVKGVVDIPVIVTGRINQPQIAEQVIADNEADLCGMTRALICDPKMPEKARDLRLDDIRACIGCNQACIGRAHKGLGVSCIQHPESGRELDYSVLPPVTTPKMIAVVGGGPAGMKAAAIAAERGHRVTLFERTNRLGGQANLAQRLPGREEFGGIVGNLEREMSLAGVTVQLGETISAGSLRNAAPDAIILATGARPRTPLLEGLDSAHVVTAWDVLEDRANVGNSVVIADWRADWIGLGLAERLAVSGCAVTLCTNGAMAGETLQIYTRNHYVGRLHRLGVTIRTHARLFGVDEDSAYFQDTLTEEPIVFDGIETVVTALGHLPDDTLEADFKTLGIPYTAIGDCVVPRTAEEAVYEGLQAGWMI